ncbi:putative transmembrane protein [Tieghemostelium lacteum]|uniref:Putative transmembrane protein n=1 Tax=Tieghemostelium lacteum TaxID=361077 RepID=A0A151Z6E5_TIELA|nr:putative transmembrane protein [Tieghemostelium lacteum]|eukprot:KYQ89515.1 putative transmembrane protein [Tieghemostelium lacteum]
MNKPTNVNTNKSYSVGDVNKKYLLGLFSEVYLAFVNWSFIVEFITVIWFFPMGDMGFTGWEICLVAIFSPILLSLGFINRFVSRFNTQIRFIAILVGFLSVFPYTIIKANIKKNEFGLFNVPHVTKTFFISVAVAIDWLAQCNKFSTARSTVQRERTAYAYALAIILHAIFRLPYISINPFVTWKNWIVFGLILSIVCLVILLREVQDEKTTIHNTKSSLHINGPSVSVGIGFGGLIFFNQLLFSTYGLIPRWVDLTPFPGGLLVIIGLMMGVVLSKKTNLLYSRNYHIFALVVGTVFGFCSGTVPPMIGFLGLICGSYLAMYTSSLWVVMVERMNQATSKPKLFLFSIITYVVLLFWAIIVVSYKFLPWYLGANLLRERHQTMIIANILCIAIGILSFSFSDTSSTSSRQDNSKDSQSKELLKKSNTTYPNREIWNFLFALLVLMLLFSVNRAITHPTDALVQGTHYERHTNMTHVENIPPKDIKAMIWTIHFGYDNFGRNSFPNITAAIKSHNTNIIGILESDLSRVMTGNRDLVEWLSYELKMYSDFGPAPSENTWGCALLTIYPIVRSKHVILPSPEGELACLIDAVLKIDNTDVNVIVTHFGNTEDYLDRKLQSQGAADIVASNGNMPTIFLSYITTKQTEDNYKTLRASGLEDTTNEGRYCEYIFYKNLQLNKFVRWDRGDISDTEAQIAHFSLKK